MTEPDNPVEDVVEATLAIHLDPSAHVDHSHSSSGFVHDVAKEDHTNQGRSEQIAEQTRPVAQSGPVAVNGNSKVYDITAQFTAASKALKVGQLVKDEEFTLFESVGALEIMDPKMDSGFLQNGETLEDDYDTSRSLLPEEVVGIMDQLLCYEMAWHHGYPLSQTIFTSIYIDKLLWPEPRTLEQSQFYRGARPIGFHPLLDVLRAYCVGLIKSCDFVVDKVASRDYFEEEDFSTHTYNRLLLSMSSEEAVLVVLQRAIKWLEDVSQTSDEYRISKPLEEALILRLRLREKLLLAVSPDVDISKVRTVWSDVMEILPSVESSHNVGRLVPESFSTKIQRRLASTVPPRPIVDFTFEDAYNKIYQMCTDCHEAVRIVDVSSQSTQEHLSFIRAFGSRKPPPLAYARSCLSSLFLSRSNDVFKAFLEQDLAELLLPSDPILDPVNWTIEAPRNGLVPKDKRLSMAEVVNDFTDKALPYYYEVWNCLCQNQCRTRRMMCNSIQFIDDLQAACEPLDEELHELGTELQYPLSTWVYHLKLRCMEWIIQLGFEQDVYLPDELTGMYWWLQEVARLRSSVLERIDDHLLARLKKLGEAYKFHEMEKVQDTQAFVRTLYLDARGTEALADALYVLYMRLHYYQLIPTPSRPYSDPSLRYELRIKPFLNINPPQVPTFDTYQKAIQPIGPWDSPKGSVANLAEEFDANSSLKEAREMWGSLKKHGAKAAKHECVESSWTKSVSSMLQSCIATGLAVTVFENAYKNAGVSDVKEAIKVEIPEPGKRYHDWWIVPKITKK